MQSKRHFENPIEFTTSDYPDILNWDQAMKAHDHDKFIKAVGIEHDGHETMGSYEPIPIDKVPKGTKLVEFWGLPP